ncbi:MAG: hypothetical protein UX74_C0016G0009 [Parcubacteria group bacterium GW2011_GWA2_47_10b]|nr:MAG: hypothetical protein UX74_C0016G0009 [Parcubacteria group bacterium GW2011_GWA2_47_10b]KKU85762.1 MAG: hypothetical protein UY14_C0014G0007 [Parcubacteria group bacterium GW2011_GWA1_47_9]OGZ47424.1 MAG: hypothetical protein A2844_02230 [Candidatus Ryanbacteria bacterium RIFCSPHIGHO2_01_FULL_48_80]OGZ50533.1 MAG: hypothetical protein A3C83_02440 [Candidatus Ryanbacteria bacterium RIFCSPHIGHO2_02_FULL_47_25]
MIYLLYGENTSASRRVLEKFLERFRREAEAGWKYVNCEDEPAAEEFIQGLGSRSLFGQKDYYIIKYPTALSDAARERLGAVLERWAKDASVVVFYERMAPAKDKLFADIKKYAAKAEEFPLGSFEKILPLIRDELSRHQRSLAPKEGEQLRAWHDENPERFWSEFEKVLLGGNVSERSSVISPNELFSLGDFWAKRERSRAFLAFEKLRERGFEPDNIFRAFLWHVKNLNLAARGKTKDMKPFVAQKAREQARNFNEDELADAYESLLLMSDPRGRDMLETRLLHFLLTS